MGTLFEDAEYKNAIARGDIFGLFRALGRGATGSGAASNPLKTTKEARWTYEAMNRDSGESASRRSRPEVVAGAGVRWCSERVGGVEGVAGGCGKSPRERPCEDDGVGMKTEREENPDGGRVDRESATLTPALTVLDTMLSTPSPLAGERSFVFVSAASSPPMVPDRYVSTKREAEDVILKRCTPENHVHPVIVRPGIMYNAHVRPVTTLPAFAQSISASLLDHVNVPKPPPGSALSKLSDAMRTHPLHVDHVADAIVRCIADGKEGVFDVETMREWAGFKVVKKEPAAA